VDAIVAAVGQDEDIVYSKSTSLQVYKWLIIGSNQRSVRKCEIW